jgi:hypothetical protein
MRHAALVLTAIAGLASVPGCYERTVSAQGMGAKGMTVQKPYRSETAADRWFDSTILGKKPVEKRPGGTVSTVAPAPSNAARKSWTAPPQ